jgi:poly-gamma-glutamate capsule biosynthesis protein CapA/YwtB (metallophosphatase superfamily)
VSVAGQFKLTVVGDVVLTKSWRTRDDLDPAFLEALAPLQQADVAFCDLETPLTRTGYPKEKIVTLRADPELVEDIRDMGFHVASLANNHSVDYGEDALLATIDLLGEQGIQAVGAGKDIDHALAPVIVNANGAKVAFLACSALLPVGAAAGPGRPGMAPIHVHTAFEVNPYYQMEEPGHPPFVRTRPDEADLAAVTAQIREIRDSVDFIAVSVHMGYGFWDDLAEYERTLSHALVDAGADVVLGNHVHTIHGIEVYKGKAIMYSPGNFVAQQPREGQPPEVLAIYEQMSDDAYIALLDVADGTYALRLIPTTVNEEGLPVVVRGEHFQAIAGRVERLSAVLDTKTRVEGDEIVVELS